MRNIKKLLSIVMVLAMVLSLGVQAFAQDVTLPDEAVGHKMVAYKIFDGEQLVGENGSSQLGVTGWAANVNDVKLLEALKGDTTYGDFFGDCKTAVDVANVFGQQGDKVDIHDAFNLWLARFMDAHKDLLGTGVTMDNTVEDKTTELSDGYWVIVDETDAGALAGNDARSTVILEVVGNANVNLRDKIDTPSVEKKVNEKDADVSSLDQPNEFKLTASLPGNFADYDYYYLQFEDTMSAGYDLDEGSFMIQYGNAAAEKVEAIVTHNPDGSTHFTFDTKDLRDDETLTKDSKVILTYKASLNENAVVGKPGNPNEVKLHYSNDPNWDGTGDKTPGTTPPDTVIVFTFKVDGSKVDGKGEPLGGAGFTLYKVREEGSTDVFEKAESGVPETVQVGDDTYTLYRDQIMVTEVKDGDVVTGYSFDFSQLGEGKYLLVETTVPAGYNKADDIAFSIVLTKDAVGNNIGAEVLDAGNQKIDAAIDIVFPDAEHPQGQGTGTIPEKVENRTGLELPETGGIGTTIFYVVGAILVAGAVILLVSKKRASGAEK